MIIALRKWLKFRYRMHRSQRFLSALGALGTIQFLWYRQTETSRKSGEILRLRARSLQAPILLRANTSDFAVFREVVIDRVYDGFEDYTRGSWIVDCGANVGYSAAFFLSRYPNCNVLSIEPDPENYELLCQNLSPYGEQSKTIQAGVWSHCTNLVISDQPYRDGQAWSRQVIECEQPSEDTMPAVSIDHLLLLFGIERISILKVDIEGAEAVVFKDCHRWLGKVDNIVIELHDDSMFGDATEVFYRAIEGQGFNIAHDDGIVTCRRSIV